MDKDYALAVAMSLNAIFFLLPSLLSSFFQHFSFFIFHSSSFENTDGKAGGQVRGGTLAAELVPSGAGQAHATAAQRRHADRAVLVPVIAGCCAIIIVIVVVVVSGAVVGCAKVPPRNTVQPPSWHKNK